MSTLTSIFGEDLRAYIDFKARTGKTGRSRIHYLRHFDAWATAHSVTRLDRAAVEGWVLDELTRCSTHRSWMSYIRDFGRWMLVHRDPNAHVLTDEWKAGIVHFHPVSTEPIRYRCLLHRGTNCSRCLPLVMAGHCILPPHALCGPTDP